LTLILLKFLAPSSWSGVVDSFYIVVRRPSRSRSLSLSLSLFLSLSLSLSLSPLRQRGIRREEERQGLSAAAQLLQLLQLVKLLELLVLRAVAAVAAVAAQLLQRDLVTKYFS
jgi:hypothetical protein